MHNHTHNPTDKNNANSEKLKYILVIILVYMIIEVVVGVKCHSLTLIADSGHMFGDTASIIMSLIAMWFANKPATNNKTFGYYRSEILASLINSIMLVVMSVFILYEAIVKLNNPVEINSIPVLIVAFIGIGVNLFSMFLLNENSKNSLNIKTIYTELLSDLLAIIGVIISATVAYFTKWYQIDAIISAIIAIAILYRTWLLITQCTNILMEGTPEHINLTELRNSILAVEGVKDVHDIHVWTITSGLDSMSCHVNIDSHLPSSQILNNVNEILNNKYHLYHTTIQVEKIPDQSINEICEPCQTELNKST